MACWRFVWPASRCSGSTSAGSTSRSIRFSPAVVAVVADDLGGFSLSKGTIRFTPETPVPQPVIERLVRLRLAEIAGS